MPSEIVLAAMQYLAFRGHDEEHVPELADALQELARVTGARNGSDLADHYEAALQAEWERQLPRYECQCGVVYGVLPLNVRMRSDEPRERFYTLDEEGCLDVLQTVCMCGRALELTPESLSGQLDLFAGVG